MQKTDRKPGVSSVYRNDEDEERKPPESDDCKFSESAADDKNMASIIPQRPKRNGPKCSEHIHSPQFDWFQRRFFSSVSPRKKKSPTKEFLLLFEVVLMEKKHFFISNRDSNVEMNLDIMQFFLFRMFNNDNDETKSSKRFPFDFYEMSYCCSPVRINLLSSELADISTSQQFIMSVAFWCQLSVFFVFYSNKVFFFLFYLQSVSDILSISSEIKKLFRTITFYCFCCDEYFHDLFICW